MTIKTKKITNPNAVARPRRVGRDGGFDLAPMEISDEGTLTSGSSNPNPYLGGSSDGGYNPYLGGGSGEWVLPQPTLGSFDSGLYSPSAYTTGAASISGGGTMTADGPGGFLGGLSSFLSNTGLDHVFDVLDTGRATVMSTLKETTDLFEGEGFSFGDWKEQIDKNYAFSSWLDEEVGVDNPWAKYGLGFIGDVALDPLTYVGGAGLARLGREGAATKAFTAASAIRVIDPNAADDLVRIGAKVLQQGTTRLTAGEVARLGLGDAAARAASSDDALRAWRQTNAELLHRASTNSLTPQDLRQVSRLSLPELRPGVRATVPGTGRVARRFTGAEPVTVKLLGQSASRVMPRGLLEGARSALYRSSRGGGRITGRQMNRLLGGKYGELRHMVGSLTEPEDVARAFEVVQAHRVAARAVSTATEQLDANSQRLLRYVEENGLDGKVVLRWMRGGALAGDAPPQLQTHLRAIRDYMDDNLRIKNEVSGANTLGTPLAPVSNWSPVALSADMARLMDATVAPRIQQRILEGIGAKGAVGSDYFRGSVKSLKPGEEFFGIKLVEPRYADGRTVDEQAAEILSNWLSEQGSEFRVSAIFSDDLAESMRVSDAYAARQMGKQRFAAELVQRNVAVDLENLPINLSAAERAQVAAGEAGRAFVVQQQARNAQLVMTLGRVNERFVLAQFKRLDAEIERATNDLINLAGPKTDALVALRSARADLDELYTLQRQRDELLSKLHWERTKIGRRVAVGHEAGRRHTKRIASLRDAIDEYSIRIGQLEADFSAGADRVAELELRNAQLEQIIARNMPKLEATRERLRKMVHYEKTVGGPLGEQENIARRAVADVAWLRSQGLLGADEAFTLPKVHALLNDVEERIAGLYKVEDHLYEELAAARAATSEITSDARLASYEAARGQLHMARNQLRAERGYLRARFPERNTHEYVMRATAVPTVTESGTLAHAAGDDWFFDVSRAPIDGAGAIERYFGIALSDVPISSSATKLRIERPLVYESGRISFDVDMLEAAIRRRVVGEQSLAKALGEGSLLGYEGNRRTGILGAWRRVIAEVRDGAPLRDAVGRHFSAAPSGAVTPHAAWLPTDVEHIVSRVFDSPVMTPQLKGKIGKAGREWVEEMGYDGVLFPDHLGWRAYPIDRTAVDTTASLDDATLRRYNEWRRQGTALIHETERRIQAQIRLLGVDPDVATGLTADAYERVGQAVDRIEYLTREASTAAGRRAQAQRVRRGLNELTEEPNELSLLQRSEQLREYAQNLDNDPTLRAVARMESAHLKLRAEAQRLNTRVIANDEYLANLEQTLRQRGMKAITEHAVAIDGGRGRFWIQDVQLAEIVKDLARFESEDVGDFLKHVRAFTGLWKAGATLSPGFHIRNYMGGVINNHLAGINPKSYRQWRKIQEAYVDTFKASGSFDEAMVAVRRAAPPMDERQFGELQKLLQSGEFSRTRITGQITDADILPGTSWFNPFSRNWKLYEQSGKWGHHVEVNLRGSLGFDTIMRGGSADEAIGRIVKYHFDYDDLSKLEHKYLRTIIPFYTWTRKNLPLQLEGMLSNPGHYAKYVHLKRNLMMGYEEEQALPEWFAQAGAFPLGFTAGVFGKNPLYYFPDVPFVAMTEMTNPRQIMASVNPLFRVPVELFVKKGSLYNDAPFGERYSRIAPPLAAVLEPLAIPFELATGVPIITKNADGELVIRKSMLHAAESFLPVWAKLNRLVPGYERTDTAVWGSALSFLGGAYFRPLDDGQAAGVAFDELDRLQTLADRAEELGDEASARAIRAQMRPVQAQINRLLPRDG